MNNRWSSLGVGGTQKNDEPDEFKGQLKVVRAKVVAVCQCVLVSNCGDTSET